MNISFVKLNFSLFICFLFCYCSYGQTRSIKGIVSDEKMEALPYITVMAKPVDKTKSMKFAMTDVLGQYILKLEKSGSYEVSFTSMGFETFSFIYNAEEDVRKDIQLHEKVNQLEAVVIDLPIVVKKDTIVYKTDKFVTGEERKLKDVLEKLPGIEVDDAGNVTSNGKKITHMLVENKKFFGGNSKLAVENIPADAVAKVEVIDDYNEVTFLKGMHKSDKMAMNIKLKEGKKNFVFGDVEAGKGNKEYYQSHANLFYYQPKLNVNFIGGINNSGKKTLTMNDYQSFIGNASSVFNSRDIGQEKSSISEFVEATDVIKSRQKVGALNLTKSLNKKLDISSYLIASSSDNEDFKETINQYLVPDRSYTENLTNSGNSNKSFGIGKLNIDYKPNDKEEIIVKALGKKSKQFNERALRSKINESNRLIANTADAANYYANGSLEWHKKIAKKHAFSLSAMATVNKDDSEALWETNQAFLNDLLPLEEEDIYKLSLIRTKKKNNLKMLLKHYWTISNDNFLHFTVGNKLSKELFITEDKQLLEDNSENNFSSSEFNNHIDFELNDFYAGLHSDFRLGKYEFAQSLFAHNYKWSVNQLNLVAENKWIFLPDFQIRANYRSFGRFRFNYRMTNSFADVSKLANRYYLRSYNSVYKGNENLKNVLSNSFTFSYTKSDIFKSLFLMVIVNYEEKLNGIINSVLTDEQDNYLTAVMADNVYSSWNGNVMLRKSLRNFKINFRTNYSNTVSLRSINSNLIENKNTLGGYGLSIQTLYDKFPVIKLNIKQSFGTNSSIGGDYDYRIDNPSIKIEYDFFKNYIFSFSNSFYRYKNKSLNLTNSYNLANSQLIYDHKEKHWGARLSVENLFDAKFKNQNNYNVYVTSDSKTFILPRIVMATLVYKL
ncbi:carboxypeptidase-like regulatory domain-containing protein [Flavicella sediminum]|uniref:carboxypeptidase-like regulatory domain-containing protein n=1 Tax=Flavicella sediminum TaxID=2585141 RepID=UPI001121FCA0|nr:carboxypeptidase-like regulatory domain-containing protein [Flavicella sediminum]